jgi:hypothetical protein
MKNPFSCQSVGEGIFVFEGFRNDAEWRGKLLRTFEKIIETI